MKLPDSEAAQVPPEKLSDYLLSTSHPVGGSKAAFFRGLGYDDTNTAQFAMDLLTIARAGEVRDKIETAFGFKYVIPGELTGPANKTASILTVWIIEHEQSAPRLVTAYPLDE